MISVLFHVHGTFRYDIFAKMIVSRKWLIYYCYWTKNLLPLLFVCFFFALFIFMYSRTNTAMYHCLYSIIFLFPTSFPFLFLHFHYFFLLLNHITLLNLYFFLLMCLKVNSLCSINEIFFNIKKQFLHKWREWIFYFCAVKIYKKNLFLLIIL